MKKFFLILLTVTPISALGIAAAHITAARATSPTGAALSPTGANMAVNPNSLNRTQILQIQQTLRNDGFIVNLDGVWGPSLQTALQQFQVSRGLPGSGTLTAQTVNSLGVNLGTVPAPVGALPQGSVQGSAAINNTISPAAGGAASPTATTPLGAAGTGNVTTSGTATTTGVSGTATGAVSGGAGTPAATGGSAAGSGSGG
jgi:peptidoglycan hydrolase-like protein with peptidoglycan-binding domain